MSRRSSRDEPAQVVLDALGKVALGELETACALVVVEQVERRDVAGAHPLERLLPSDRRALVEPGRLHFAEAGRRELTLELRSRREAGTVDRLDRRQVSVEPERVEVALVERCDDNPAVGG